MNGLRICGYALLSMVLMLSSAATGGAQTDETGFLNRSVSVEEIEYKYQIYVPREFERTRAWPTILALHGGGAYGSDGFRQTERGVAAAIRQHVERFPAIVVFPQSPADGTAGWHGAGGRAALAALDATISEFGGDPHRVYLTGHSAGGNGSWYLASRHPERFAAVVVVCGWVSERDGTTSRSGVSYPDVAPASASDPFYAVAELVSGVPIWLFHGDADTAIPVSESRRMAAALEAVDADVRYTELPGVGHNAWDPAYGSAELLTWMLEQRQSE